MTSKQSIKVSDSGLNFLKRLRTNRRKTDIDDQDLPYWQLIELVVNYFKANNVAYLGLIKKDLNKNV